MKELKEFTVELLEQIIEGKTEAWGNQVIALAKIALAAKQGMVALIPEEKPDGDGLLADGWNACRATMLYTTPPLNHTEQDGWTSSDAANAALVMLDRIETIDPVDDDRIEGIKSIIHQLVAAQTGDVNDG